MTIWLVLTALSAETIFPEQTPGMIESCLYEAVATNSTSTTDDQYKYICSGQVAQKLWSYLEKEKVHSWEQTTENGVWLSREFPLGGCFKRVRNVDGSIAADGLSCTVWIPRPTKGKR